MKTPNAFTEYRQSIDKPDRAIVGLTAKIDEANRAHSRRSLTMRRNPQAGMLTIAVEVPIEDGELIEQAISKAMEKYAPATPELASASFRAEQADALVNIARDSLVESTSGRTSSADAYQVVVHVDQSALTEGTGRSDLPVETVKRLMCDGSVVPMFEMATVHKVVGAASLPRFFQR